MCQYSRIKIWTFGKAFDRMTILTPDQTYDVVEVSCIRYNDLQRKKADQLPGKQTLLDPNTIRWLCLVSHLNHQVR